MIGGDRQRRVQIGRRRYEGAESEHDEQDEQPPRDPLDELHPTRGQRRDLRHPGEHDDRRGEQRHSAQDCVIEEDVVPPPFGLEHETPNHGRDQPPDDEVRDERSDGNNRQADDDLSPVGEVEFFNEILQQRLLISRPAAEQCRRGDASATRPRTFVNILDIARV